MCGIAGLAYSDPGHPVDRALVERMTDIQAHRGPDGRGFHFGRGIGLGHRRLSIIDVSGGDQPMVSPDGTKVIVFNGEIYNFLELRRELEARGHRFRTRSDTEVLLRTYEAWGPGCVERLHGMFAFAIWDEGDRTLFLARDRVGKKPLYYAVDDTRLIFASEMKGLLRDPALKRSVNVEALDAYLAFGTVPAPLTIFQGVHQLQPAHTLTYREGRACLREYWDLEFRAAPPRTEERYLEELGDRLAGAVGSRLMSEVPLGAFLSGGVDSSAVVAAMAELSTGPVLTENVGFHERAWDESGYARTVARRLGTDHRETIVSPSAAEVVPRLVWHFDEPFADSSAIPTYYVCRAARERVTVALSGDGGDEVWAGYQQRYGMTLLEARLRRWVPAPVRRSVLAPLAARYPKRETLPRPLRLGTFLSNLSVPLERAFFHDMSFLFRPEDKALLYSGGFREALGAYDPFDLFARAFRRADGLDPLSRVLYVDFKTSLPNDMLTKVDRMSMASSLEVRCPLLDHRLVEFAAGVPADLKYRGSTSKYLLKRHLVRRLPADLVHRRKMGFSVPLGRWLRHDLRSLAEELLFSRAAAGRGYFEAGPVRALWDEHLSGRRDHAPRLWGLMMLELWHRTFLDRPGDGPVTV